MQEVTLTPGSRFEIYRDQSITIRNPGMTDNGTIAVFGQSGWGPGSLIWSAGSVLDGVGLVTLSNNGGTARLWTTNNGSDTGIIGSGITINGDGQIAASFTINGTIAPGNRFGQLQRPGNIIMNPSAVLDIEIGGAAASQRDSFVGTGALRLRGTLRVRFSSPPYRMPPCSSYTPVSGGQITGRFTTLDVPRGMQVTYFPDRVTLFYNPADFNSDAVVDFFDYLDFVQAFSIESPDADYDGDGIVDFFDYLAFVQDFASPC